MPKSTLELKPFVDPQVDRRRSARFLMESLQCRLETRHDNKMVLTGRIVNVSKDGALVSFPKPLPVSDIIDVVISLPQQYGLFTTEAIIVWIEEKKRDVYHYGINLVESGIRKNFDGLREYIKNTVSAAKVVDRRKHDRRWKNTSEIAGERRRGDRRGTGGLEKADDTAKIVFLNKHIEAGYSTYSKLVLSVYDTLILKYSGKYIWRCSYRQGLKLYNKHISSNHLEIGVGTAFLLDYCRFPSDNPRLVISDLNENCLEYSSKRLKRYSPEIRKINLMKPISLEGPKFDSVALTSVLHCLPGTIRTKASVFRNLKEIMNSGGVIFGATVLNGGVEHTRLSKGIMKFYNSQQIFSNLDDDFDGLQGVLKSVFSKVEVKVIGTVAVFWAIK